MQFKVVVRHYRRHQPAAVSNPLKMGYWPQQAIHTSYHLLFLGIGRNKPVFFRGNIDKRVLCVNTLIEPGIYCFYRQLKYNDFFKILFLKGIRHVQI
jgi:hypothetical protein